MLGYQPDGKDQRAKKHQDWMESEAIKLDPTLIWRQSDDSGIPSAL